MAQPAPDQKDGEKTEITEHERPGEARIDMGQEIGAGNAPDDAWNHQPTEQPPVDVAMDQVIGARCCRRETLNCVNGGGDLRGRHTESDKQRAGKDTKGHAQRAVHQLRREPDSHERQDVGQRQRGKIDHPPVSTSSNHSDPQWDRKVGSAGFSSTPRVAPPRMNSRKREWPYAPITSRLAPCSTHNVLIASDIALSPRSAC